MKFKRRTAILVDEMNVMHQLHRIGIQGINPWDTFYCALQTYLGHQSEKHFYGANVPEETYPDRYLKRTRFFKALERSRISVHQGHTVLGTNGQMIEKGVDVLLAIDLSAFAFEGYQDIVICTGDSDMVPAIQRAQLHGAKVHVVVSENIPAALITEVADEVIRLEDIIKQIPKSNVLIRELPQNLFKESVAG